tara:strand:+ start:1034 stop:1681 length:648 start_codon:yes stop_codon:yes gene_type:complete
MKRYIEEHQTVDLGFDVKPIFRVDVKKLQDWYNDLQENYKDWKFIVGENHHVWQFPISDPTGKTGHIIPDETGYYTLCWNSDEEGPKPFEQGCAKPEYKDNDNDELNPRKCFTGYGLDVVKSLPFRSKKWLVTEHVTGTKLITHQDSPDKIRVHIPIHTNKDSNWIINGKEYHMEPGWAYLVNTTLPHSVENKGTTDRVHLYGKVWTEDVKAWLM